MKIAFPSFRSSLLILTTALLFSCGKELPNYPASSWTKPVPQGEVDAPRSFPNVDSLVRTAGIMATVHSSVTRQLREGLTETDMNITLSSGKNNHLYITPVESFSISAARSVNVLCGQVAGVETGLPGTAILIEMFLSFRSTAMM